MKKKGIVVRPIIFWALGILVLFVVIFVIIGPEQLLAKARDAAFDFGLGVLPGEAVPELSGGSAIPGDIVTYFESLVASINSNKEGERCLIPLEKIPDMKDYVISLSEGKAEIKRKKKSGIGLPLKTETIEGFNPCVVAFWGAENFFNNWFDGSVEYTHTPEYYKTEGADVIRIESRKRIRTPNEGNNREYKISDELGMSYLYKPKKEDNKNLFCFISIEEEDDFCEEKYENEINEGCFKDVLSYDGLMLCEDSADSARERILYVKIDPGNNPVETWAFRLISDKNFPRSKMGNNVDITQRVFKEELLGKKVCNVFSVNEEGNILTYAIDHLATWYIAPGGRIMTKPDANRIFDGIYGKILGVTQDPNNRKGSPNPTDNSETVGGATYSDDDANDHCGNDYEQCALLARGRGGTPMFTPKHELLCDDEGYWNVCGLFVDGVTKTVDGATYTCEKSSAATWVWR